METNTEASGGRERATIVVQRRWALSAGLAAIALLAALIVAVSVALDRGSGPGAELHGPPQSSGAAIMPPGDGAMPMPGQGAAPQMPPGEAPQPPEGGELPEGGVPPEAGSMPAPPDGEAPPPQSGAAPQGSDQSPGSTDPLTPDSLRQPGSGSGSGQASPTG